MIDIPETARKPAADGDDEGAGSKKKKATKKKVCASILPEALYLLQGRPQKTTERSRRENPSVKSRRSLFGDFLVGTWADDSSDMSQDGEDDEEPAKKKKAPAPKKAPKKPKKKAKVS